MKKVLESAGLDLNKQISISMDGPAVNKLFFEKYIEKLQASGIPLYKLIDVSTCPLHIVHNAFKNCLSPVTGLLTSSLEEVLADMHTFFKLSFIRREIYFDSARMPGEAELPLSFTVTRWLSMDQAVERFLDQYENLKHFSLMFFRKQITSNPLVQINLSLDTIESKVPSLSLNSGRQLPLYITFLLCLYHS